MEHNDLNKIFFTETELPVPVPSTDLAWEQMQNRLDIEMPQKEKRKKWFIIFFFLLALLIGPAIIFRLNNDNYKNNTVKNIQPGKNESVSQGDMDKERDSVNAGANNNSSSKNETDNFNNQKNDNTAITDANKTSVAKQNISIHQNDNLISANNNNADISIAVSAKTNKYHKQKKKATSNYIRRIKKQQHISTRQTNEEIANEPTTISTEKNVSVKIAPSLATADQDSSSTLADKNIPARLDKKNDSLDNVIAKEEDPKPADEKSTLRFGIQWNLQIPTGSASQYFTGGNLKSQPYLLLIPGIWTSLQVNRSMISVELNPYYTSLVPSKTYTELTSTSSTLDTVKIVTESRQLNKLIGSALSASFGYNIKNNWWLKGGVQMQWWRKGIATAVINQEKYPVNNSADKTFSSSSHLFAIEEEEWNYFTKFQVNLNMEALYTFKKWETALRIGLPVAPITSSGNGPKNSVRTELILRYQLLKKQK
jgi:hypothetical protein